MNNKIKYLILTSLIAGITSANAATNNSEINKTKLQENFVNKMEQKSHTMINSVYSDNIKNKIKKFYPNFNDLDILYISDYILNKTGKIDNNLILSGTTVIGGIKNDKFEITSQRSIHKSFENFVNLHQSLLHNYELIKNNIEPKISEILEKTNLKQYEKHSLYTKLEKIIQPKLLDISDKFNPNQIKKIIPELKKSIENLLENKIKEKQKLNQNNNNELSYGTN